MMKNLLLVCVIALTFLCTVKLKVKYSNLCVKKVIKSSIYWEGRGIISKAVCRHLREIPHLVLVTILTISHNSIM